MDLQGQDDSLNPTAPVMRVRVQTTPQSSFKRRYGSVRLKEVFCVAVNDIMRFNYVVVQEVMCNSTVSK